MINNTERRELFPVLTRFVMGAGNIAMFLNGILVFVTVLQVIMRYVFGRGLVSLEELEWHLWAVSFLFGMSYCLVEDTNIRMDIFYKSFSRRTKEWMDALGILFLLIPFIVVMIIHGLDFTEHSWNLSERSDAPLGLPYRWIIKASIPISMVLLGIAAMARLGRFVGYLRGGENGSE